MAYVTLKSGLLFDSDPSTNTATTALATSTSTSTAYPFDFAGGDTGAFLITFNPSLLSVSPAKLVQGSKLSVGLINDPAGYKIQISIGNSVVWNSASSYEFGKEHTLAFSWTGLNTSNGSISVYLDGNSIGGTDTLNFAGISANSSSNNLSYGGYNGYIGMLAGFTTDVSSQLANFSANPSQFKYTSNSYNRAPSVTTDSTTNPKTLYFDLSNVKQGDSISITSAQGSASKTYTFNSQDLKTNITALINTLGVKTPEIQKLDLSNFNFKANDTITFVNPASTTQTTATYTIQTTDVVNPSVFNSIVPNNYAAATALAQAATTNNVANGILAKLNQTVGPFGLTYDASSKSLVLTESNPLGSAIIPVSFKYTPATATYFSKTTPGSGSGTATKTAELQKFDLSAFNFKAYDTIGLGYFGSATPTTATASEIYVVKPEDIVPPASDASAAVDSAKAATTYNVANGILAKLNQTVGPFGLTYDASSKSLVLTESAPLGGAPINTTQIYYNYNKSFTSATAGGYTVLSPLGNTLYIAPTSTSTGISLASATTINTSNLNNFVKFIDSSGVEESALSYVFDLADQTLASYKVSGLGSPTNPYANLMLFGDTSNLLPSNQASVNYGGGTNNNPPPAQTTTQQTLKSTGPIYAELVPSSYLVTSTGNKTATVSYNLFIDKSQDAIANYNSFGYTVSIDPNVASFASVNPFTLPPGATLQTINNTQQSSGSLSVQWAVVPGANNYSVNNYKTPVGTVTLNVNTDDAGKAPPNLNFQFSDISIDNQYFSYTPAGASTPTSAYIEKVISDAYPVTFNVQRNYNYAVKSITTLSDTLKNPGVSGVYIDYQVSNKSPSSVAYLNVEKSTAVTSSNASRGLDISVHANPLGAGETRTLVIDLPSNINYDTVTFTPYSSAPATATNTTSTGTTSTSSTSTASPSSSVTASYTAGAHSITIQQSASAGETLGVLHVDLSSTLATPSYASFLFNSVTKTNASVSTIESGADMSSGFGVTDSSGLFKTVPLPRGALKYSLTDPVLSKANTDKITLEDARAILGLAAGSPSVTALGVSPGSSLLTDLIGADFNGDGRVTAADVINIMNYVVATNKSSLKWAYVDQSNASQVGTKTSFPVPPLSPQQSDMGATMSENVIKLTGIMVGDLVTSGV